MPCRNNRISLIAAVASIVKGHSASAFMRRSRDGPSCVVGEAEPID